MSSRMRRAVRSPVPKRRTLRKRLKRFVPHTRKARAGAALVVMLVGLTVYVVLAQPQIVPAGPPPPDRPRLREFTIVYRVTDSAGETPTVRTEIAEARRPYESRIEARRDPPDRDGGGTISSGSVTNREFFWALKVGGAVNYGARRPPSGTQRDYSYGAFRDAVRHGLATSSGTMRVAGRTCRRFAYKEPFPKPFAPPTIDDSVESCVSRDGLPLREVWTIGGKLVHTEEAMRVSTRVTDPRTAFMLGHAKPSGPATDYIEQQQKITEDKVLIEGRILRPATPAGFVRDRRASLYEASEIPRSAYLEAYVRGPDVAVVEQGTTGRGGPPPFDPSEGLHTKFGARAGRIVLYADHVEARLTIGRTYVRIRAPDEALARYFATTLRPR